MATIEFTNNYDDLSTDMGFQFKFYCNRCRDGYMSTFKANAVGVVGGLLRGAGDLFGGIFNQAGHSAYDVQRAIGGGQHDGALREAVTEVKPLFNKCRRCGDWVCGQVCWNTHAGMCKQCAPSAEEEETSLRAGFVRTMVQNDLSSEEEQRRAAKEKASAATCPECGTATFGKKFCPGCGSKLDAGTAFCGECGAKLTPGAKFCGECGARSD